MTIIELLKTGEARISSGSETWMYWDGAWGIWVVLRRKARARRNVMLYEGDDEEQAVAALVGEVKA